MGRLPIRWMKATSTVMAMLSVMFSMTNTALAYVARADNPPDTSGSIVPNGQIVGGTQFVIRQTNDPTLVDIQDRSDRYKYGSDGMPISNGNDTLGGIWGFDHVNHNGVPISSNNGYKMVGQSTVSQWSAALKGDPSYVQTHLWNTTFVDSAGQTFPVSNVSQIVEISGASFVPGDPWYDQPVDATDPPRAQVSIVGSTPVQQGIPLQFENHAWIEAYHTAYHFEYVTVTSASGQDVRVQLKFVRLNNRPISYCLSIMVGRDSHVIMVNSLQNNADPCECTRRYIVGEPDTWAQNRCREKLQQRDIQTVPNWGKPSVVILNGQPDASNTVRLETQGPCHRW